MKKIVIVCGLISGGIVAAMLVITIAIYYNTGNFDGGMALGYATMLLAFSLIFIGIKNYRDKHNDGIVSFKKAFIIGLYISLIASTVYVAVWLVDYYLFVRDFMDKSAEYTINTSRADGDSEQEINKQVSEMAKYKEWYKNPLLVILLTYSEILPVGLVVSLISALILRRNNKLSVQPS